MGRAKKKATPAVCLQAPNTVATEEMTSSGAPMRPTGLRPKRRTALSHADSLGRAGFDGNLDTHFWDRFGGALLLSIVDDGSSALAGPNRSSTARVPSDAAAVALQNSVNIPPSLRKAQGSEVSIFVAQDFDFSGVYGLRAR